MAYNRWEYKMYMEIIWPTASVEISFTVVSFKILHVGYLPIYFNNNLKIKSKIIPNTYRDCACVWCSGSSNHTFSVINDNAYSLSLVWIEKGCFQKGTQELSINLISIVKSPN